MTVASELIREDDEVVYGDSAYLGLQKRPEVAGDERLSSIDYRINLRPSSIPTVSDNAIDWTRWIEKRKSSVRCKVEHIFRIIKCQLGYRKARYRGLKKNENRLLCHVYLCEPLSPGDGRAKVARGMTRDSFTLFVHQSSAFFPKAEK